MTWQTWRLHLVTGQSLAVGVDGTPVVSGSWRHPGKTFIPGNSTAMTPLVAGAVEVPAIGLGDALYAALSASEPLVRVAVGTNGSGGTAYTGLKKGTATYTAMVADYTESLVVATGKGRKLEMDGFHIIHGHSDMNNGTSRATYLGYLEEWRADLVSDVSQHTDQGDFLTVIDQSSNWVGYGNGPDVVLAQLDAHRQSEGIILACSTYCVGDPASVHKSGIGYYHLGEYHARAFLAGSSWNPLMPTSVVRSGAVITVEFDVPTPPLAFDTSRIAAQTNMGFGYTDDTSSASISSVALGANGTSVEITLNTTPTGANPLVGYGTLGSTEYGNLRDSEDAVSISDGATLANWCVQFLDPVTT